MVSERQSELPLGPRKVTFLSHIVIPAKGKAMWHVAPLSKERVVFFHFPSGTQMGREEVKMDEPQKPPPWFLPVGSWESPAEPGSQGKGEVTSGGGGGGGKQGTFLQHPAWVCFRKRLPFLKHHKSRTNAHKEESLEGFHSKGHRGQVLSTSIQLVVSAKPGRCYREPREDSHPNLVLPELWEQKQIPQATYS